MKIEDDFLDQKEFDELQTLMLGPNFAWHYIVGIDYKRQKNKFMFVHTTYADNVPRSPFLEKLNTIIQIIQPMSLWRIKANLLTRTPTIVENEFHVDIGTLSEEKLKQWTTSIFYVNTNNGYTKFKDGTKVESVANRMVTFPANMKHTGTTCTDEKTRIVINFNYFTAS
tara:strand:+ start:1011 stop:1517 length:507 start_codon:yes stop_codon:yes gene_type:complete